MCDHETRISEYLGAKIDYLLKAGWTQGECRTQDVWIPPNVDNPSRVFDLEQAVYEQQEVDKRVMGNLHPIKRHHRSYYRVSDSLPIVQRNLQSIHYIIDHEGNIRWR